MVGNKSGLTVSTELTVILQDVQHSTHLRKDEDARTLCFHGFQKLVKNEHFTGVVNKMLISGERRSRLGAIKDCIGCQQMFEEIVRIKVKKRTYGTGGYNIFGVA